MKSIRLLFSSSSGMPLCDDKPLDRCQFMRATREIANGVASSAPDYETTNCTQYRYAVTQA